MTRKGLAKEKTVGLISAVPLEGKPLMGLKRAVAHYRVLSLSVFSSSTHGLRIIHAISGIGKVNAAHAATVMIREYSPELIVNFGVGGAYPGSGLEVGDVAVATREINADEGLLLKEGLKPLDLIGIPVLKYGRNNFFNEFPVGSANLLNIFSSVHFVKESVPAGYKMKVGPFATVSACTGTSKRAEKIHHRFGVICENMEGAAIAQICLTYRVPMIELRGISNMVEDRAKSRWDLGLAAGNCRKVLNHFLIVLGGQ